MHQRRGTKEAKQHSTHTPHPTCETDKQHLTDDLDASKMATVLAVDLTLCNAHRASLTQSIHSVTLSVTVTVTASQHHSITASQLNNDKLVHSASTLCALLSGVLRVLCYARSPVQSSQSSLQRPMERTQWARASRARSVACLAHIRRVVAHCIQH